MDKDRLGKQAIGNRLWAIGKRFLPIACCLLTIGLFIISCSSTDIKREIQIPKEAQEVKPDRPPPSEPKTPEFIPVTEDVSPVKTRIVDIVARNTPLRDVLHVIAEATGLNLAIEKGVAAETPVTLTLKNVSAEDALNTIFTSVDYFYTIKDNMLIVKAVDTRIFEIGHPAIVQTYNIDVGGDILGGAGVAGGGGSSNIKGNVVQSAKSDSTAFNFWDGIEKGISSILGMNSATTTAASPSPAPVSPASASVAPSASAVAPAGIQQNFTVNRLTGTIVVTASKKSLERVEQYINTIKRVINRQVLVEAKIIEVQLSEGLKYGIDWSFVNQTLGDGQIALQTYIPPGDPGFRIPSERPYFNMGITRGTSFSALLNALKQQGEVRTLSNPRVNIMNGQTSLLSVGRNVTFVSRVETSTTTTGTTPTTTYTVQTSSILSGIIIGIVPYINENGEISLTITPIVSNLVQLEDKTIGQAGQNQIQISLPTVDLRELSTTVKVRDGQMVIIGGLIKRDERLQDDKTPLLGDIPVLGGLFMRRDKSESRTELVVVLQPILISR